MYRKIKNALKIMLPFEWFWHFCIHSGSMIVSGNGWFSFLISSWDTHFLRDFFIYVKPLILRQLSKCLNNYCTPRSIFSRRLISKTPGRLFLLLTPAYVWDKIKWICHSYMEKLTSDLAKILTRFNFVPVS